MLRRPLVQRHRALARGALYALPIVAAAAGWASLRRLPADTGLHLDWMREDLSGREEVQLLREYLRVDTSATTGDEVLGAELLARRLEAEGIRAEVIRTGGRHANVWAILEGDDPSALVLHNHIDVDPVREHEKWSAEPFGGEYHPPWIYGRGAFDMKSVAVAQLLAFVELARAGAPLRRSLAFLATGSEETGSWLGTRWILRNRPDIASRLGAVLTEGGAVEALDSESVKYWGTEVCQKRFVDVRVCDGRRERLVELRESLYSRFEEVRLDLRPVRRHLYPELEAFFAEYGPTRDLGLHQRLLEDPRRLLADDGFFELPPYVKAMLRNELFPFGVEEEPGGGYSLLLSLHVVPGVTDGEAWEELLPAGALDGLQYTVDAPPAGPACSSVEEPVFRAIDDFMKRRHPRSRHGPLAVPWAATDARFFRAQGIPSFGVTPFLILSTDTLRMTGADERIAAPAFVDGVALYRDLVRELVTGTP